MISRLEFLFPAQAPHPTSAEKPMVGVIAAGMLVLPVAGLVYSRA
jgi:hypothetical protein